eukprot:NODE_6873_length_1630_cov_4.603460.p1 GENE.NODE_6873_length_1630_cov_4.603460~~NODE_6873_length_1630_cov_4.603460.p1  ORF type:complete len:367 (+),score=43.14 NODE_6873_length_1630_cov_4.603460:115-1101(+)
MEAVERYHDTMFNDRLIEVRQLLLGGRGHPLPAQRQHSPSPTLRLTDTAPAGSNTWRGRSIEGRLQATDQGRGDAERRGGSGRLGGSGCIRSESSGSGTSPNAARSRSRKAEKRSRRRCAMHGGSAGNVEDRRRCQPGVCDQKTDHSAQASRPFNGTCGTNSTAPWPSECVRQQRVVPVRESSPMRAVKDSGLKRRRRRRAHDASAEESRGRHHRHRKRHLRSGSCSQGRGRVRRRRRTRNSLSRLRRTQVRDVLARLHGARAPSSSVEAASMKRLRSRKRRARARREAGGGSSTSPSRCSVERCTHWSACGHDAASSGPDTLPPIGP